MTKPILIAAVFTPFRQDGTIHHELIPELVDHLKHNGIDGIYINGSTGEGPSLSTGQRKEVAESYLRAAQGKLRTIVHIGHTAVSEMQVLANHAEASGADALSAIAPFYYKPEGVGDLLDFYATGMKDTSLPFYYYHMPAMTGALARPTEMLKQAAKRLPQLAGIKFTDTDLSELTACQSVAEGRYEMYFGRDEMLLSGLLTGAVGAVGSTYNFAPALYDRIRSAMIDGDLAAARSLQAKSVEIIQGLVAIGGEVTLKLPMRRLGLDCGGRILPCRQLTESEENQAMEFLDRVGFDEIAVYSRGRKNQVPAG